MKHLLLLEVGGLLPTSMGSRVIKYSSRFGGGVERKEWGDVMHQNSHVSKMGGGP